MWIDDLLLALLAYDPETERVVLSYADADAITAKLRAAEELERAAGLAHYYMFPLQGGRGRLKKALENYRAAGSDKSSQEGVPSDD